MRVVEARLHVYQSELRKVLMPRETSPQAGIGRAAGAQAPGTVTVLLEQCAAGVPNAYDAAQVVGGKQHCIVLSVSCFDGCNSTSRALDVGVVGYLISNQIALSISSIIANGGRRMPAVLAWLDVSLLAHLHTAHAASVMETGEWGVGCSVVVGEHVAKIVKN